MLYGAKKSSLFSNANHQEKPFPWVNVLKITFTVGLTTSLSGFLISCKSNLEEANTSDSSAIAAVSKQRPIELSIVSYAVTRPAYANIIPLFKEKWKKEHNQEVNIRLSNAGSGIQTKAVTNGLPADVVHLALELDVNRLQKAGLIQPGWQKKAPNNAIVARTVGAIVTRPGNPKNIRTWSDLAKPGISIVTADPRTSGIARWNFLAFWGAIAQTGATEAQAVDFVTKVYSNVPVLAKDARDSTDIFSRRNQGDVLINYENELINADQEGLTKKTAFVIPDVNISIDGPVAVVDKYVDRRGTRQVAEAFVQFLYSPEAQREFAKAGFRPFDSVLAKEFGDRYAPVTKLFTVQDLGGWEAVQNKFFKENALFDQMQSQNRASQ